MSAFTESITVEQLECDPYPIYARLRKEEPVAYIPAVNSWFLTSWEGVNAATQNPKAFQASDPNLPICKHFGMPVIIHSDGDTHAQLRQGIAPHYMPRKVADYIEGLVRPIAEEYLEVLLSRGRAELMAEYFEPISALSLVKSFGLDVTDVPTLRRWFAGLSQGAINFERDPKRSAQCFAVMREINTALSPVLDRLEQEHDGSPLSYMLHGGMPEGEVRQRDFITPSVLVTLLGGMQEPGHGAGSTLVALLSDPKQMDLVLGDLEVNLGKAVNEGVRWMAPIGTQGRTPCEDIEFLGVTIPKGDTVSAVISSASRDEAQFEQPDVFDLTRRDIKKNASFGFGSHFCAGKWFALAQMELAIRILLENTRDLQLDKNRLPEFRGWEFRAPTSLHVRFAGQR